MKLGTNIMSSKATIHLYPATNNRDMAAGVQTSEVGTLQPTNVEFCVGFTA